MRSLIIPLSFLLTIVDNTVHALIFPFDIRVGSPKLSSLTRRTPVPITNIGNAQYVTNITVAGVSMPVLLDTGSSDLWVHFPTTIPTTMTDTGKSVTLAYAVGKTAGNINTAAVQIGNATMANQAFLFVNDTSSFTSDIRSQGYDGLLGLGPNSGSVIRKKIKNDSANTLIQRIFEGDRATDNYITVLLNRKADPGATFTGQFTISEVVPGFENITSMPKLDVETVNRILKADQHWQALTDKNVGIIGPDGQPIQMKSIVPNAPKGQYVAVLDSGYTFSQIPRAMSDAIYGRVRGAIYDSTNEWWLVPCGQYLNVSFNFGGVNYPIHPLDLVDDNFAKTDSTGKKVCIGAFQPITSAFSLLGHYDMILGMSFLRSSYALLDFGNWIGDSPNQDHPYMQMLSTVNPAAARTDFISVRLGGNDTTSDARWQLLPTDQTQHSPVSAEEKKKMYQELVLSRWPYILVGCLAFVMLSVGLCVWRCCARRKARKQREALGNVASSASRKGGMSLFSQKTTRESYVPLADQNRSVADLSTPYTPNLYPQPQQYGTPPHTAYPPDQEYHEGFSNYREYQAPPGQHHA